MKRLSFLLVSLLILFGGGIYAAPAPTDELMAAAKKEGALDLYAAASLGPEGAKDLAAAFNKKYGLNIRVNYNPSASMTTDIAKVISMSALGVAPDWDLMLTGDSHHATLGRKKLHLPFDYRALGVDAKAIQSGNGSVAYAHGITLPAYNRKILEAKEAPGSWEDLLDPKWKGGKLGVSSATHYLARLAAGPWGEKKTTEFVKALSAQRPFLGNLGAIATRLQLGEILVASGLSINAVHRRGEKAGAPLASADKVEPVLIVGYNAGVLKGARHPNAAHLFTAFMVTPESQAVWEDHSAQASVFVPGTTTYQFAKGKRLLFMRPEDAELVDRLSDDFSKLLGFRN